MRNIFRLFLCIGMILQFNVMDAQSFTNINMIDVTGKTKMEIIPDKIFVSVTIDERTDVKNAITFKQQEDSLLSLLKKMQIATNKIQMKDAGNNYLHIRKIGKSVIAHKTYLIELQNVKQLNLLFFKLDNWMVYKTRIERVDHSKIDSFKRVGEILAVKNAQEKANYLLAPLGKTTGNVLYVSDVEDISISGTMNYMAGVRANKWDDGDSDTYREEPATSNVEFETMKLEYRVVIKFEIK